MCEPVGIIGSGAGWFPQRYRLVLGLLLSLSAAALLSASRVWAVSPTWAPGPRPTKITDSDSGGMQSVTSLSGSGAKQAVPAITEFNESMVSSSGAKTSRPVIGYGGSTRNWRRWSFGMIQADEVDHSNSS